MTNPVWMICNRRKLMSLQWALIYVGYWIKIDAGLQAPDKAGPRNPLWIDMGREDNSNTGFGVVSKRKSCTHCQNMMFYPISPSLHVLKFYASITFYQTAPAVNFQHLWFMAAHKLPDIFNPDVDLWFF